MNNKNSRFDDFITVLTVFFSIMSFIGTIGLFRYFGNTHVLENQTIAYAGVCIAGSIVLAILLLIRCISKLNK